MSKKKELDEAIEAVLGDKGAKEKVINAMLKQGEINKYALRNYRIRKRYNELTEAKQLPPCEARRIINAEFFLCDKQIQNIIYNKTQN